MSSFGTPPLDLDEVVHFFSGNGAAPSALGAQLEKLRDGVDGEGTDVHLIVAQQEREMMQMANLLRCVESLRSVSAVRLVRCPHIKQLTSATGMGPGEIVVCVMHAYQSWATQSRERALAAVYGWMRTVHPSIASTPKTDVADGGDEVSISNNFRLGRLKCERNLANGIVDDAHRILALWVDRWNAKYSKISTYQGLSS